ncbi:hypothetical protein [Streptomyces sp. NPDC055085]
MPCGAPVAHRALVAISVDPDFGEVIPGDTTQPELRQPDGIEHVRVLYFVTAQRTVVVPEAGGSSSAQTHG